jgi:hypothetical protein
MLHIATVHWQNGRWIEIQLRYLNRHLTVPFRVYAFLDKATGHLGSRCFYSCSDPITDHATKLNRLADVIQRAAPDARDLLIFLDGDAFPIGDVGALVRQRLQTAPLTAVQRRENNGDRQPHPCFCATTVGFWREIGGDWSEGHTWVSRAGKPTTDVGGNLLGVLERQGIAWHPLLRSNRLNLHPVWFGIYADVVYHHGAGFRSDKVSRADLQGLEERRALQPPLARAATRALDYLLRKSPVRALRSYTSVQRLNRRNTLLSEEILARIERDEPVFAELLA